MPTTIDLLISATPDLESTGELIKFIDEFRGGEFKRVPIPEEEDLLRAMKDEGVYAMWDSGDEVVTLEDATQFADTADELFPVDQFSHNLSFVPGRLLRYDSGAIAKVELKARSIFDVLASTKKWKLMLAFNFDVALSDFDPNSPDAIGGQNAD